MSALNDALDRTRWGGSEHILVVDDETMVRAYASAVLERYGYRVQSAKDGEEGLSAVAAARPDLIVLDVSMPKMSGDEVARRLRRDPVTREIPILISTGYAPDNLLFSTGGSSVGYIDLLQKPYRPRELVASVRLLLDRRAAGVSTIQLLPARAPAPPSSVPKRDAVTQALAEITGAVCHDLANVLSASRGLLELANDSGCLQPPGEDLLARAIDGNARATNMVRDLHRFARLLYADPVAGETHLTGKQFARALRPLLPNPGSAQLAIRARGLTPEFAIPAVLARTLLAPLVANALEAETSHRRSVARRIDVRVVGTARALTVTVSDNGPGWPVATEEIWLRLRSPTPFTSKGAGHGQGLALVGRVLEKLGGSLRLGSRRPKGARVELSFPWG